MSIEDLRAAAAVLVKSGRGARLRRALDRHGPEGGSVSDVPEDNRAALFLELCEAAHA